MIIRWFVRTCIRSVTLKTSRKNPNVTKSEFISFYSEHIFVSLDIFYNLIVYQYVIIGILYMLCIFIGIFKYRKFMINYYFVLCYSININVSYI